MAACISPKTKRSGRRFTPMCSASEGSKRVAPLDYARVRPVVTAEAQQSLI